MNMAATQVDTRDFENKMRSLYVRLNSRAGQILFEVGQEIIDEVQSDVPIRSGALRSKGMSSKVQGGPNAWAEIKFSSFAPHNSYDYAALQHEVDFNHPRGGKDHYLIDNIKQREQEWIAMIEAQLMRYFR